MSKPKVLFAASEVYPFAKSGGLGDVAYSLPRALNTEVDVHVVMPLYSSLNREQFSIEPLDENFEIKMGDILYKIEIFGCDYEGQSYRFVYAPLLCEREFLYGPPECGYEDNALRFGIFNYALVAMLERGGYEIAHLNDWQSALVPLLLKENENLQIKTIFTIHNLAYQGIFDFSYLEKIGVDEKYFTLEGVEFYNQINFLKAGIAYADSITTVSPKYAKEILTPAFGCGLEGFLKVHEKKLKGILNGIDTQHFSPPFCGIEGKALSKKAYLQEIGFKGLKKPLFVFVSRFTWQKGMDLLIEIVSKLALKECNIAILGEGEEIYNTQLKEIAAMHPNVHVTFGYDEPLSHRMYGAADFLLMPSLFEPCGLSQLIAMHFGTLPIVHKVGGLADTVQSYTKFDAQTKKGCGLAFTQANAKAFMKAVNEALALYKSKKIYNTIVQHNLQCDFSWDSSARVYGELYEKMRQKEKNHA